MADKMMADSPMSSMDPWQQPMDQDDATMSSALPNQSFTGGHDVSLVDHTAIPEKYMCIFCKRLLKEPIQILHGNGEGIRYMILWCLTPSTF